VPGAPHAGACRTKRCILTTNYEQKSRRDAPAINSTKKLSLFEVPYNLTRACLHSPCPQDGGDEIDDGSEAPVGLLIARGNASKGFYAAEEVFDEMPPLVFFSVMLGISAGSLAERNDRLHVVGAQSFAQPAGIKSLVADQGQAMDAGHESVKAGDVVPLAWQEHEADQIAERIDDDRDLRRQAAARFADGLILSPPFAPVPC
jgi:hypothetical protein